MLDNAENRKHYKRMYIIGGAAVVFAIACVLVVTFVVIPSLKNTDDYKEDENVQLQSPLANLSSETIDGNEVSSSNGEIIEDGSLNEYVASTSGDEGEDAEDVVDNGVYTDNSTAAIYGGTFSLDNVSYVLGQSLLRDFESHNWTVVSGEGMSRSLNANSYSVVDVCRAGDAEQVSVFSLTLRNATSNSLALDDCIVDEIWFGEKPSVDFVLPEGVNMNMNEESIKAKYGEPFYRVNDGSEISYIEYATLPADENDENYIGYTLVFTITDNNIIMLDYTYEGYSQYEYMELYPITDEETNWLDEELEE